MAESSGGLRLDAVVRKGACGTWWSASTADGRTRGMLQVDPALTTDPAAVERAAEQVAAVRALNLPGFLRTTDLVADAGRVWLIAAAPPVPVFTDLAAAGLDPAAAAFLVLDVGHALVRLHQAGLYHGALGPDTVAVTSAGFAVLTEVGLWAALTGTTRDAAADARAWCRLVRVLAATPGDEAATAFAAAASLVEAGGPVALEPALRTLTEDPSAFVGFPSRASLSAAAAVALTQTMAVAQANTGMTAEALAQTMAVAQASTGPTAQPAAASASGAPTEAPAGSYPPAPPPTEAPSLLARTQLGRRAAAGGAPLPASGSPAAASDSTEDSSIRLRFGPGVPAAPAVAAENGRPAGPSGARAPRRRTLWTVLSGALTLVMVLGAGAVAWWRYSDALAVTGVTVAAVPTAQSCDVTVDIIGTVRTNGRTGRLRYEWLRNDGQTTGVLEQRLNAGTSSTQFRLRWTLNGKGTYEAAARLRILAPTAMESADEFTYHC